MPERLERLRTTIHELEAELSDLSTLDPESRQLLMEVSSEIQAALKKGDPASFSPKTLTERLDNATQSFEASHPTLAGVVHRVVDALGQWGI